MKRKLPDIGRVSFGKEVDPTRESEEKAREYIVRAIAMTIDKHPLIDKGWDEAMREDIVFTRHESINHGKTYLLDGYITIEKIYKE